MKYKSLSLLVLLLLPFWMQAQSDSVYKYWVSLTDKEGCSFSLDHPEAFLSPRALERRQRQSIAVDSLDLPVSEQYVQRLERLGFRVQNRSKWLNGVTLFVTDTSQLNRLDTLPFVASRQLCEYGTLYPPHVELTDSGMFRDPVPYDTAYSPLYYMCGLLPIDQIHGRPLHWAGHEGQGMIIGLCDGGFPGVDTIRFFDTMRMEGRLLATRDFVWDGNDVFNTDEHGTAMLSIIGSYIPGSYVGTAPKASYVLCRTENALMETPMEMYNWVAAAEYLDSLGADVVSTSLGYYHFDNDTNHVTLDGHSAPITIGAEIATSRGMLMVASAGNNGMDEPPHLAAPADGEHVMTVGAVNSREERAPFSSPGPTEDGRIKPDVMAQGVMVLISGTRGYTATANGTSASCPLIAGMMTCLWQRFPDWTPQQLCDSVRSWGDHANNPDNEYGYGVPDFSHALNITPAGINRYPFEAPCFELYPNPALGTVNLRMAAAGEVCAVTVTDINGRLVRQLKVDGGTTESFHLTPGIYLFTLTNAQSSTTHKVLVK